MPSQRAERLGAGGALLVGNLALIWAQELLHTAQLSPERQHAVHALYDAMLEEGMYGQYLDVMGTGRDADNVEVALRIILTRPLPRRSSAPCSRALPSPGPVFGSTDKVCAPGLSDLREGKRTVLLALDLQAVGPVQRQRLGERVGRPDLEESGASEVRAVLEATGARDRTEAMISARHDHVVRLLEAAAYPPAAYRALHGLAVAAISNTS